VGETHCSRAPYILNLGAFVDHAQGTKTLVFPVAILPDVVFVTSHCENRRHLRGKRMRSSLYI